MTELRRDPIVGRPVLLAPGRSERPDELSTGDGLSSSPQSCPFCPGHESETPPEIWADRAPDGSGWLRRVFPNKYPVLKPAADGSLGGVHEVIVETPDHDLDLGDLPAAEIAATLRLFRARLQELARQPELRAVLVFKNRGGAAGATLAHSHSQLLALPFVPPELSVELEGAERHYRAQRRCIYCELSERAAAEGRLVLANATAIALCPWAPRTAFESWILPRQHQSGFEASSDAELEGVAALLGGTLRRLQSCVGRTAYNLMLATGPLKTPDLAHYHWQLKLLPIRSRLGGLEWGSGLYVNSVPPEVAAARLREAT